MARPGNPRPRYIGDTKPLVRAGCGDEIARSSGDGDCQRDARRRGDAAEVGAHARRPDGGGDAVTGPIAADARDERRVATEGTRGHREVRGVAAREERERFHAGLPVSGRSGWKGRGNDIENRIPDRKDRAAHARHTSASETRAKPFRPSSPPEARLFQFFDDDLVFRRPPAAGTKQRAVGIARGLVSLPVAEATHRVVNPAQKKSSKVSFRSVFWTANGFAIGPRNASRSRVACVEPMYKARSSHP